MIEFRLELAYRPHWWPKRSPIFVKTCQYILYVWYIWHCTIQGDVTILQWEKTVVQRTTTMLQSGAGNKFASIRGIQYQPYKMATLFITYITKLVYTYTISATALLAVRRASSYSCCCAPPVWDSCLQVPGVLGLGEPVLGRSWPSGWAWRKLF